MPELQTPAPGVVVVDDALSPPEVEALSSAIAASQLVGDSQLVGGFVTTRGFGIACHASAIDDAVARAPFLAPFVALAIDKALRRRARPRDVVDRVLGAFFADVTALYLNVLVVPPGGAVERHVDATLGVVAGDPRTLVPHVVVALYVDVPPDLRGGRLRLDRDGALVAEVEPRRGRLVCFDGRLAHEVTATTASGHRVSCVAELYRLPQARLRVLPRCRVQSNGFAGVLARGRVTATTTATRAP